MLKLSGISLRRLVLLSCALLACPCVVAAAPGACVENPAGVFTCSGDHAQGIASGTDYGSPPAHTLIVDGLSGAITPSAGQSGIDFRNSAGGNVTIKSGTAQQGVVITTQGTNAAGIKALGTGAPSGYTLLPGLGIRVPAGSSGAGGPVAVESHGTITTHGAQSHGISAQNAIGTYDPAVVASLQAFSASDVTTALDTVEGVADNIGRPVAGDRGGLFTLAEGGGWHFDADTLADTLEAGESVITTLHYEVLLTSASGTTRSEGALAVLVHKVDDDTLTTTPAVYFNDFNVYSDPNGATPLWPNLQGYVDNLLADMGIAGAGESVAVVNHGNITTAGAAAHGIVGRADGGKGANGTSGSFWNAWLVPEAGGRGANGGAVHLVHDGSMQTAGTGAHGVVAESRGGGGGTGGHGSLWHPNGAQGGTGGTGGAITVTGAGAIRTDGHGAVGILAQSSGGAGGAADTVGIGGAGGFAGRGGSVDIQGNWAITTTGDLAHGIWGKSLGGSAGPGGSGGWLISQPGAGGEASDGGLVSIASGGAVSTLGDHAYGLYAQSIGGAGGTGASTFGLLWSYGGDGGSAGSGGTVSVVQEAGGAIVTRGEAGHGVVAQSIGGGGGIGSDASSLIVSVGGPGGAGGAGGAVSVINRGEIRTHGGDARGVFAQSIGGGGGDTGASTWGLISIGGLGDVASHGGSVTVANSGVIATQGAGADAVFAESIGGGGGTGTSNVGAISVGGFGTGGGHGGSVHVSQSGTIRTEGELSRGIFAHSIGGGGGDGRFSLGVLSLSHDALVGSRGGGQGGAVSVANNGAILTLGELSDGIFAQSIGGGGGRGGTSMAVSAVLSLIDFYSLNHTVSLGGGGGGGGRGGAVSVHNSGLIATEGANARGVFAQSVGGGGGHGGQSLNGSLSVNTSFHNNTGIGGTGGEGGDGHTVHVSSEGTVATLGDRAEGLFAQSVGGGGGAGGTSALIRMEQSIGLPSIPGTDQIPTLDLEGTLSSSIGGSGGNGGAGGASIRVDSSVSLLSAEIPTEWKDLIGLPSVSLSVTSSVGGSGGAGGVGGTLSVANGGTIVTTGANAAGLFAQSVGGGGGAGGHSFTVKNEQNIAGATVNLAPAVEVTSISSIGGAGGGGGTGGAVTAANTGQIHTTGNLSAGLLAQSVGGGGGTGGTSMMVSREEDILDLNIAPAVKVDIRSSISGSGAAGGVGGTVEVHNGGWIETEGAGAAGIFAQSVGGGGGAGGASITAETAQSLLQSSPPAFGVKYEESIGGAAGAGALGGIVSVSGPGDIVTRGDRAIGVFAQSVGGGGGAGGASIAGATKQTLLTATLASGEIEVASTIGGTGGTGGNGGAVTVDGGARIATLGDLSHGILAQSVGGGGGAGGAVMSAGTGQGLLDIAPLQLKIGYAATVGGSAAAGGTGGAVTVTGDTHIHTQGDMSHGIFAQSVGGGGGAGGAILKSSTTQTLLSAAAPSAGVEIASVIGGTGGAGGAGGAVAATFADRIITEGSLSHGVLAQSIGGGGGAGGAYVNLQHTQQLLTNAPAKAEMGYASILGGSGGAGGNGGCVAVAGSGAIETAGALSHAIFAQSVGGGGGIGGGYTTLGLTQGMLTLASDGAKMSYSATVGGSGGAGGTGGDVAVAQDGLLVTRGDSATGLFAQSVGGGGGNGAEVIALNIEQSILTASAGEQLVLELGHDTKLGGDGSGGGAGGAVSVGNTGGIATAGHAAKGLVAQSVGGGGGRAGAIVSAEVKTAYLDAVSSRALKAAFAASIGGSGGAGGDGGAVEVVNEGAVQTLGRAASALVAQSVGGGGGLAEYQVVIDMDIEDIPADGMLNPADLQMVFSDTPGSAGNGGAVSVQNRGDILTEGAFSSGIIAQSVGGGGGLVEMLNAQGRITTDFGASMQGMLLSNASGLFFAGSVGGNGSGGAVIVENSGDIMVLGDHAYGIFAQSAGGAGAGAVQVTAGGNIVAPGVDASAILAQSAGGAGNGDITVTITDGIIMGGTGQGAGVSIQGGASNTLTNHGAIGSIEGLQGRAICGTDGDETLYNFGTIEGAIDLGSGVNTFWNAADGLYASGAAVTLGDGNRMVNAGVVSPGGLAAYQHTELTGDYTQTATGHLEVQIDHDGRHDRLAVNGGEASLDGSLSVLRDTGQAFQNGTVYTLLTAGHIDGVFSMIDLPEARPMLRFVYNQTTEAIEIRAIVPSAVTVASNRSAVAIGRYLDTILPGATGDLSYVLDLFQNLSLSQFDQAFESLSPAAFDNLTQVSHIGLRHYAHSLHQRMALVRSYANTHAPAALNRPVLLAMADTGDSAMPLPYLGRSMKSVRPPSLWISGRRHWGQAEAQPRTGFAGYDYRISAGAIGLDLTFAENGMLGLSINKGRAKVELERHQGEGKMESLTGALYGGLFSRNAYLEGSLAYGVNHYRNQRHLTIGPEQRTAYSEHKADVYPAHLAGGYLFNLRGLFLGPAVSLRYTYLKETPFTETGADSLNLKVDGRNTKSLVAEAGLRGAYLVDTSVGRIMPEIGAALIYDFDIDDRVITAAFDGSPDHVFSMPGRDVEQFGLAVDAGLTYVTPCGISTAVKYQGEFRNRFQSHGIMGELRFQF